MTTDYTPLTDDEVTWILADRPSTHGRSVTLQRLAREVQDRRKAMARADELVSGDLRDPMGLLLAAARVDPVLMRAARQVEAQLATMARADELGIDIAKVIDLICPPPCETCNGSGAVFRQHHHGIQEANGCPDCAGGTQPRRTLYERLDYWISHDDDDEDFEVILADLATVTP